MSKWGIHWTYTISRGWVLDATGTRALAFNTEEEARVHVRSLVWKDGREGGEDISRGRTYTAMPLTKALLDARIAAKPEHSGTRGGRPGS
jgi:hypothetical protein